MYMKKIHQFLSSIKKMHINENWFLFSASRCRHSITFVSHIVHNLKNSAIFTKLYSNNFHVKFQENIVSFQEVRFLSNFVIPSSEGFPYLQ